MAAVPVLAGRASAENQDRHARAAPDRKTDLPVPIHRAGTSRLDFGERHRLATTGRNALAFFGLEGIERRGGHPAHPRGAGRLAHLLHRRTGLLRAQSSARSARAGHRLIHHEVLARQHAHFRRAERVVGIDRFDIAGRASRSRRAGFVGERAIELIRRPLHAHVAGIAGEAVVRGGDGNVALLADRPVLGEHHELAALGADRGGIAGLAALHAVLDRREAAGRAGARANPPGLRARPHRIGRRAHLLRHRDVGEGNQKSKRRKKCVQRPTSKCDGHRF